MDNYILSKDVINLKTSIFSILKILLEHDDISKDEFNKIISILRIEFTLD